MPEFHRRLRLHSNPAANSAYSVMPLDLKRKGWEIGWELRISKKKFHHHIAFLLKNAGS